MSQFKMNTNEATSKWTCECCGDETTEPLTASTYYGNTQLCCTGCVEENDCGWEEAAEDAKNDEWHKEILADWKEWYDDLPENGKKIVDARRLNGEKKTPAYEFFRIEGWGNLFVKIGDGLLTMACKDCRRPTADCMCLEESRKRHEAALAKDEFIASLPRKMTEAQIRENEHTKHYARGLFDFERGWAGAWVRKDKNNAHALTFTRYK